MQKRKKQHCKKPAPFRTEPDILKDPKCLGPDEKFQFGCNRCGECCRNVEQSVLVESLDLYRIAAHLRKTGHGIAGIEDVVMKYADIKMISENVEFPILLMKTQGQKKECVFLKNGRCSIHEAKPRACRCYPLNAQPKDAAVRSDYTGTDIFDYVVVSAKQHHFQGPSVRVADWMNANFSETDRDFVMQDVRATLELAPIITTLQRVGMDRARILMPLLLLKYISFELDEPFMPQFTRNMDLLKRDLFGLANAVRAKR